MRAARVAVLHSPFARRLGARAAFGRRVVDTYVSVSSSRSISYIYTLGLGKLWEFYLGFRLCALINYTLVILDIGETYPEDVRGQARLGGYNPATYLWVGTLFLYLHVL